MYSVQMVSITPYPLKAASLEQLLVWEQWVDVHSKDRRGSEEPSIVRVKLQVTWHSHPLQNLLQHSYKLSIQNNQKPNSQMPMLNC